MIATDMDGTLLNDYGKIPEENAEALRRAQDKGVIVAVNSGRYAENAMILMLENNIPCPVIGTNGAKILSPDGKTLALNPIAPDAVRQVCDYLDRRECLYYLYGTDFLVTNQTDKRHHSEVEFGDRITALFGFQYYHGPEEIKALQGEPILKFYICHYPDLPGMRRELSLFKNITVTSSGPRNIEISPYALDKATGIRALCNMYQIDIADVAAFGDQENDLPALDAVGWGFAMENGDWEVQKKARFHTCSNNLCGVARAIEKYVLEE